MLFIVNYLFIILQVIKYLLYVTSLHPCGGYGGYGGGVNMRSKVGVNNCVLPDLQPHILMPYYWRIRNPSPCDWVAENKNDIYFYFAKLNLQLKKINCVTFLSLAITC